MPRRLPPLKSLIVFESVVRTGNMTAAAEELSVTHSAVSKQVTGLEDWLGRPLFDANRRQMIPTPAGERLASAIGRAFDLIAQELKVLEPAEPDRVLQVIAPASFGMRWLMPRLPVFYMRRGAGAALQVRLTNTPEPWLNIPFDVAIRRGGQIPAHFTSQHVARETLGLFAAPQADAAAPARAAGGLPAARLLAADTRPGELEAWLEAAGEPAALADAAVRFPHFYVALEAALMGQGALVCSSLVVADLVERGDLAELRPEVRIKGAEYRVVYDASRTDAGLLMPFVNWLTGIDGDFRAPARAADRGP